MSDAERQAWLSDYQQWLVDFPKVETIKSLSAAMRDVVERGLSLLSAFNYCKTFVAESLRCKDYHRRLKIIRRLADRVTADVQKSLNQAIDLTDPTLLIPHVGRPTKQQSAARALARQKEQEDKEKSPNLFNTSADDASDADNVPKTEHEGVAVTAPFAPVSVAHSRMPAIAEVRWLLSPALQAESDTIRDLRSRFEEASTRAKQMAEDGRSPEDIKPYAQEAGLLVEQYEDIYARIDTELQTAYVRLKEDSAYIAKMSAVSRMSEKELRTFLRPFWDKLSVEDKDKFKAAVIEQIKANDPVQAALRKESEEKKALTAKIIKYLQRKDKPNTLKRVKGIEKKIAELRELIGDEADNYLPILTAAKEDYETNIRPAEEAVREARAAARQAKDTSKKSETD